MEHRSEHVVLHALGNLGRAAAQFPAAGTLELQRDRSHFQRNVEGWGPLQRRGERRRIMAIGVWRLEGKITGWNIDGTEPADQPALERPDLVDVPGGGAFDELLNRIRSVSRMFPQPVKHIVVTIEDRLHFNSRSD